MPAAVDAAAVDAVVVEPLPLGRMCRNLQKQEGLINDVVFANCNGGGQAE